LGGRRQGGISPSREAPVVMFFTDPVRGHRHGYYDGLDGSGNYHYVGEGQIGDQVLAQGNKAIQRHVEEGRKLEGFLSEGVNVTYLGEFECIDMYWRDAHESGNSDVIRQVIVHVLRPLQDIPVELPELPVVPPQIPQVDFVSVEEQNTERAFVVPDREPYEMERAEAGLVHRYRRFLLSRGHNVSRAKIIPPGEGAPLYSDLWDETTGELVEAKASVARDHIRMAVGQMLDYRRFVSGAKTFTILVPQRPRDDLVAFIHSVGLGVLYPDGEDDWKWE
jgi:hypothetical protein